MPNSKAVLAPLAVLGIYPVCGSVRVDATPDRSGDNQQCPKEYLVVTLSSVVLETSESVSVAWSKPTNMITVPANPVNRRPTASPVSPL